MRYGRVSDVTFDLFQLEVSSVSAFADDCITFVEGLGAVRNQNLVFLFQAGWHTRFPLL